MATETLPHAESPMIIFRVRKSRLFLIAPLAALSIAALLLVTLMLIFNPGGGISVGVQLVIFAIGVVGFGIGALVVYIDWSSTYFILTSQTVERTTEFITRSRTYMSLYDLAKIESRTGL